MNLDAVDKGFNLMAPRKETHVYSVKDYKNEFYITSNKESLYFEVFKCDEGASAKTDWKKFYKPEEGNILKDFLIFDNFIVVGESERMDNRLKIMDKESGKSHVIKIKEEIHLVSAGYNPNFDTELKKWNNNSARLDNTFWYSR